MKVEHILQNKGTDVFTVSDSETIADAVSILNEKNIGAVIVKDGAGRVAGILSERDIVRRLGEDGTKTLGLLVRECMTPKPFTCALDAALDDVLAQMTDKRIRHLPVTNGDNLVGVISIGDVVKRKIEMAEQEAQALKDYISS